MLSQRPGRSAVAIMVLAIVALASGCDAAPPTTPQQVEPLPVAGFARGDNGSDIERGTFTIPAPRLARVDAPCVDPDNPLRLTGTWSGWYHVARTANGHVHTTEHIDWSDVTLVAADGRTWKPGPGAHESFSLNRPATAGDLGERAYTIMHNLRARFLSQDGGADLLVWHVIHIVLGPDLEYRVDRVVLPFEGRCIGGPR